MLRLRTCENNITCTKGNKVLRTDSDCPDKTTCFFATSDPVIPIAIPTSARFKAGESLTPSPASSGSACIVQRKEKDVLIAQNNPRRWSASTIRTLLSGAHRAMTSGRRGKASISAFVSLSNLLDRKLRMCRCNYFDTHCAAVTTIASLISVDIESRL